MQFSFKQFIVPHFWKKFILMITSVIFMGVTLSFLIEVAWGTDPASFLNLHISRCIGLSLGNTQILVYFGMFIITFIFGPEMIGFGTIANSLLIGHTADLCMKLWDMSGIHNFISSGTLFIKILVFAVALLGFVFSAAIYMNAGLGVAPYDALPKIIWAHIKRVPFFVVRICFDLVVIGFGILFGILGPDGILISPIGATIMALLLGPAIGFVGEKLKV